MAVWTTISPGLDWQDVSFMNELVTGVNERVAGLYGGVVIAPIITGQDIQGKTLWRNMQNYIESLVTSGNPLSNYLDDLVTISGSAALVAMTKTQMFTRAGLTSTGWRRAISWDPATDNWSDYSDPMYFAHGQMETGDIIGPWIFQDLQNCMTALKWTASSWNSGSFPSARIKEINLSRADCATALADSQTIWNATGWTSTTLVGSAYNVDRSAFVFGGQNIYIRRYGSKFNTGRNDTTYGTPPLCPFNWETYHIASDGGATTFIDLDNLGLVDGGYYLDQSGGPSATWNVTTPNIVGAPADTWPPGCNPAYACPQAFDFSAALLSEPRWVYKWQFSNA